MTVHAFREGERLFEIAIGVAPGTIHSRMFALQREFCLGVVKALVHGLQ